MIEIWANSNESEFAIRLDSDDFFRAKSNSAMADKQFTKMVETIDFLDDVKYYWEYTLEHWIEKHKSPTKE